ncbi:MAG: DNA topology modulation protein [Mycobacterium leprae]
MERIVLIGSGGAGKSTLAKQLAARLDLPVHHLDALYWKPGWTPTPRPEWEAIQRQLVTGDRWIIDGNYAATMGIRLAAADTVIYLDYPRLLCLWRAFKRVLQYRKRTRPDMGEGCPEMIDREFVRWIWRFPIDERPKLLERLAAMANTKQVIRLRSPKAAARFLSSL